MTEPQHWILAIAWTVGVFGGAALTLAAVGSGLIEVHKKASRLTIPGLILAVSSIITIAWLFSQN